MIIRKALLLQMKEQLDPIRSTGRLIVPARYLSGYPTNQELSPSRIEGSTARVAFRRILVRKERAAQDTSTIAAPRQFRLQS